MKQLFSLMALLVLVAACTSKQTTGEEVVEEEVNEVNVYTHRHYEADKKLFAEFEATTGIKVNVVNASADELINRMELEGEDSPADILITVDAGRLHRAKEKGLLQAIDSETLNSSIPQNFRDSEGYWYGVSYRARIIAYSKDRVDPSEITDYESLADPKWQGKVLIRSSGNIYNQSLMASIIASQGSDAARSWAEGVVANMAREPKGNDRDQVKAVAAGLGDVAVLNTYYIGKLLDSKNPEEVAAGEAIGVIFPNQESRGTHVNVSGAAVARHAPNQEHAVAFLEYLTSDAAQTLFAESNFEYPVKPGIALAPLLESWGSFKTDSINLGLLGKHNKDAVLLFDQVGWK